MKILFQRLFIVGLIVPFVTHSMEMPSHDRYQEFLEQYNQILDEHKKIQKEAIDYANRLGKEKPGFTEKAILEKALIYQEYGRLQQHKIKSLENKKRELLKAYADVLNEDQKNELRYLTRRRA